jgi:hypothetical protein
MDMKGMNLMIARNRIYPCLTSEEKESLSRHDEGTTCPAHSGLHVRLANFTIESVLAVILVSSFLFCAFRISDERFRPFVERLGRPQLNLGDAEGEHAKHHKPLKHRSCI